MSGLSRRDVLRSGGLVVTFGAIAAACGSDTAGPTQPGRIGIAPPIPTLPEVEDPPSDVTLLRTAQSFEYAALDLYPALIETGVLTGFNAELFDRIVADHKLHAEQVGLLVAGAGGEEYKCANAFLVDRSIDPSLAAMDGSDDMLRDVLNIAFAFETLFGASYQSYVQQLTDLALRTSMIQIGAEEQRHAAVLARVINPDQTFAPTFFGQPEVKDPDGFPIPYAIPSTFGKVSPIELVVGNPNAEGARFSTLLQTPAQNTFVYEYMSC